MGKESVCWSWDESREEKGKGPMQDTGRQNQMCSLSCALFNDESPLASLKTVLF